MELTAIMGAGARIFGIPAQIRHHALAKTLHRTDAKKIILAMKLTAFLVLISCLQVSARTYSQTVTLAVKNESIINIFTAIEEQTGYGFFYDEGLLHETRPVTISVKSESIGKVLQEVLKNENLDFTIDSKTINVFRKKRASSLAVALTPVSPPPSNDISIHVTDSTGAGLANATVVIKGSRRGGQTDKHGDLSLVNVGDNVTLIISFTGYETQEIKVYGNTQINVQLKMAGYNSAAQLSDVVVVGYGKQKKIDLTGAVAVIDSKSLKDRPVTNAFQALQGLTPGLNLTVNGNSAELGGTYNVNIRGYTSINGGEPLVLVDGVRSSLDVVNAADIESISVLKDQASSAIYGAQAAYGVLMITTKRGKTGKMSVNYSNNLAIRSPLVLPKNMNSLQFATMYNTATSNDNIANVFSEDDIARIKAYLADPVNTPVAIPNPAQPNVWGKHNYSNANTDWYSTIYKQNVFNQQHNLNVSGGNENIQYYLSGSFLQQDGLLRYGSQQLNKYTFNGNLSAKINSWLRVNFDSKYTSQKINRPSFSPATLYGDLSVRWPNNYVKDPNGYYSNFSEVLKLTTAGRNNGTLNFYNTTGELVIEPVKNWITNISLTKRNTYDEFDDTQIPVVEHGVDLSPVNVSGVTAYQSQKANNAYTTASAYTAYEKQISDHYFKAMVGWQYEYNKYTMVNATRQRLVVNDVTSLSAASGDQFVKDDQYEWANDGFFGRINYNYREKYLVEINARADGSSRFPENSRWGFFPSVSAGYVLSKENYWSALSKVVNFFKIRASYGKLGNQSVSTGTTNAQYYPYIPIIPINLASTWIFADNTRTYASAPSLVYSKLTWETVKGWNIGFTGTSFNNRLSVDFDIYRRITENMIGPVAALPAILGTAAPQANNATMATTGYELLLNWKDRIGDFNYSVTANLADYQGKILAYNNPTMLNNTYYKGSRIGEIWGYETVGLFQTADEVSSSPDQTKVSPQPWKPGDVRYKDRNGDKVIDFGNNTVTNPGDRTVIGNNTPRYSYGFGLSCSWKGFDFSMYWQGVAKRDLFVNNSNFWGVTGGQFGSSGFIQHLNYWTPDNTGAYYPRPLMSTYAKNQEVQSRYLLNAAYLRLKSLQLGYTIPVKIMRKVAAQQGRIYISGENLLTSTKMPGQFDPEVENNGRSYPLQRALSAGLNITF